VIVADVDETAEVGESAHEHVTRLAMAKARAGWVATAGTDGPRVVIGADTVVVLDGVIFGKPTGPDDAAAMLRRLSGRRHDVLSAVAILHGPTGTDEVTFVDRTSVRFVTLTEEAISAYVATGEPLDKAGSYGIQAAGGRFVADIDGSYHNVVGLPLARVAAALDAIRNQPG
jgi:septum formation protein